MSPGAKSTTKHQISSLHSAYRGEQFSISFRKIKYTEVKDEWPFIAKSSAPTKNTPTEAQKTTLVLGTSIPYYLDYKKLAGSSSSTKVGSLCKRGAKISTLQTVVDEHYKQENPCDLVDKVIVSVGTNDLRNNKKTLLDISIPQWKT